MTKMLRKLSVYLTVMAMMLLTVLPMNVQAAETGNKEEMVTVYVQVPQDWEAPHIWAWDEEGNNAFDAWPGAELELDTANDGWYYGWIPSWANHVILNGNEGNVQTEEQILESKNAWLTVSADAVEISYEQQTQGDIPEYVESFKIHASVPESWTAPSLWAWSAPDGTNAFEAWPGNAMTAEEDGWYTAKAPTWVNSIIVNANEGQVQTEDITVDPAEVWLTIAEDGSFDLTYNDPNQEYTADINVHVKAPEDWDTPCLWAWSAPDGTNVFTTWPGEALTENENGWLEMRIPGWVNSLIVNGNEGSVQTSDISVEAGKEVWLVVADAENAEVYYEEPQLDETADNAEASQADKNQEKSTDTADKNQESGSQKNIGIIIAVIAVVVVIAAAALVIVMKRKK